MERALIHGLTEMSTRESGKMVRDMVSIDYLLRINLEGHGKVVFANGDVFDGIWEEDIRKSGRYTFLNGTVDEVPYQNGKKHGEGTRNLNGVTRRVLFKDGQFVRYLD